VAIHKGKFRAAHGGAFRAGKQSLAAKREAEHISVEGNGLVPVRSADADPLDALHDHCKSLPPATGPGPIMTSSASTPDAGRYEAAGPAVAPAARNRSR